LIKFEGRVRLEVEVRWELDVTNLSRPIDSICMVRVIKRKGSRRKARINSIKTQST
jgi:hypothetical protein